MTNIVNVTFNGKTRTVTDGLFQYDYGQILNFTDLELPEEFEIDFTMADAEPAETYLGENNQVQIPNKYLQKSGNLKAYIYLHTGDADGETVYTIVTPVRARPERTDPVPSTEQKSRIDTLIEQMDEAVETAETSASEATQSASDAQTSAESALDSANRASTSEANASLYASQAQQSATSASESAQSASTSADRAEQSATEAQEYADRAGFALDEIDENTSTFINTTVPNAVQSVTSEGTAQVASVQTAGQAQIENVNTAGTTQVGNVNTAGATQVGAVQAKGEEVLDSIPADYTEMSDDVTDLKTAFGAVRDIADAVGVVFPYVVEAGGLDFHADRKPTVSTYLPDRRAHTSIDYPLVLPAGTVITPDPYRRFIVIATTDGGSSYTTSGWQTAAYTLASDSTVFLALASARSGESDAPTPASLASNYTITLPDGSTGLIGDVTELISDLTALTSTVTNLSTDYTTYKTSVGLPLTQYLDATEWVNNTYWKRSLIRASLNGYQSIKAEGLKSGTYHINRGSAPFTYFKYADGTIKRASDDFGLSDWTTDTSITIPQDFDLYLTVTGDPVTYEVMVTDGSMPETYVTTAGVYAFDLTDEFKASVKTPIYCGSTREYTTLKSAIEEATKTFDSVVYVDAETFDLVNEFGSEWLENYSEEANCGLMLKNRVHVIFASGAKVVFNYTGNNEYIQRRFSPFNAQAYGFTLENAYVESTHCRYSVHDERGTADDGYHNIYKRCTFIHDSTGTTWGPHQCIGGGLGKNGDVLIEDCYMENAGTATTISYHNSNAANAESKVIIKDSYLSSTALISNYGTSTKKTKMIVTNCSLGAEPIKSIDGQYTDNVELIKWNNLIR